jgi:hypothetical protein
MIEPTWKRIAAFHCEDDGTLGAVWFGYDDMTGVAHLYDVALFRNEIMLVMTDGIAARGRHIPLAWAKKDKSFADEFLNAGINVLPDHCVDTPADIAVWTKDVTKYLKTNRLKVEKRLGEWLREYKDYHKDGSSIPVHGFPLMSATRHAIQRINYAQAESFGKLHRRNHPKLAIV